MSTLFLMLLLITCFYSQNSAEAEGGGGGGVCKTGNKKGKELIVCEFKLGTAVMEKIEQPSDRRAILLLTSDWQTFFKIGHPLPFFL